MENLREISKEQAGEQDWVVGTSPRVDSELIGKISNENLSATLEAIRQEAVQHYGSELNLQTALVVGEVIESGFRYEGEHYVVHVGWPFAIPRPTIMVMHEGEAARAKPEQEG